MCVFRHLSWLDFCFFFHLQASFTPFLTEHTYQSLRPYIPESMKSGETESIHYLMIPQARYLRLWYYCYNIVCSFTSIRAALEVGLLLLWSTNAVKMSCNSAWIWFTTVVYLCSYSSVFNALWQPGCLLLGCRNVYILHSRFTCVTLMPCFCYSWVSFLHQTYIYLQRPRSVMHILSSVPSNR